MALCAASFAFGQKFGKPATALLHTVFYLMPEPFARVLAELTDLEIWSGWIAFVIFIPLAATSFDFVVAKMGTAWKRLQTWVYVAAVLTLLHWASLHDWEHPAAALVHFAPLGLLTLYRLWRSYLCPRLSDSVANNASSPRR